MSSTFGSFEIGRRALHAQQKGSEVTGQNIANANTEGYSRQSVLMKALVPPAAPGVETPPGYGVAISDITRMKSQFYSDQIMKSLTAQHYWGRMEETYGAVEVFSRNPAKIA
jgi:flagellar hook-associated protein 1 FlgK